MQQLFDFIEPDVEEVDGAGIDYRVERNLERAAEFLVAYDISRRGYDCFTVGEGLRYDLIADVNGVRRIQVKSNRRARQMGNPNQAPGYNFGKGKGDLRDYVGHCDLIAFVAMDRLTILYAVPERTMRAHLWVPGSRMTPEFSDLSWAEVMRSWRVE
jgi:hypothetical protein